MNADFLSPGEEFSWIYKRGLIKDEIFMTWEKKFKKIYQIIKGSKSIKVTAKFDEALVNKCLFAKSLIKKSVFLTDLGSYILPRKPMETNTNGRLLAHGQLSAAGEMIPGHSTTTGAAAAATAAARGGGSSTKQGAASDTG